MKKKQYNYIEKNKERKKLLYIFTMLRAKKGI